METSYAGNYYMALILFFDYNPNSHYTIRQLGVFHTDSMNAGCPGK